jgi:hypothetical protein
MKVMTAELPHGLIMPLDHTAAALMPASGLAALAAVRCRADVTVILVDDRAWVTWPPGDAAVWHRLLAVPGVRFFEERDGAWYELGHRVPAFDLPPTGDAKPFDRVLFPAPLATEPAPPFAEPPVPLRLVPSDQIHATTALRTTLAAIQPWADRATTAELTAVRAARCGGRVLLRGDRLPVIPDAERFWGDRVLAPLGCRVEPDLPETAIRAAAGVSLSEVLILTAAGVEAVPEGAFAPLTRAGVRIVC